jgi:hypothetical protein
MRVIGTPEDTTVVDTNEVAENLILKALTVGLNEAPEVIEEEETLKPMEDDEDAQLRMESISDTELASSITITSKVTAKVASPSILPLPEASASTSLPPPPTTTGPLCPNLQRFDFTLCDASQYLLCDFVSSRWENLPPGVSRIKSVKCNFTAFEDESVKSRMQKFREEGLDAFVTYQVPINDDMNPSPWMGLEGPP